MAELWAAYNESMDTIIYLYHSRGKENFNIEKWQEREYCLIRLGIPMLLWQNLKKLEQCFEKDDKQNRNESKMPNQSDNVAEEQVWRRSRSRWHRRKKKKLQNVNDELMLEIEQEELKQKQKEKQQKELQPQLYPLLDELSQLQTALCLLGDNPYWTYCVYEEYLRERIDTGLWRECWTIPEFKNYQEYMWSEELMKYATCEHFLILGYAPYLPRILYGYAEKMRSVKWLLEPERYTEAVQEFIEDFYDEYGLAISLQLLEAGESWLRVRPKSAVSVNVLDFSREEKLLACDIARESVWLDMDSMEGKERRIEARCPHISYFSLKKQWKQRQKEPSHLDTTSKNRYNT